MDRRGSGIGRILNSFAEFVEKPEFFPNEHYFLVMLPNRSVAEPAQTSIDLIKTQLGKGYVIPVNKGRYEKTQMINS